MSQQGNRKMRPIYLKAPRKVIKEYFSTIYVIDFWGRVTKHSKDNVKLACDRKNLFEKIPEEIKMIIGGEMDVETWNKLKNESKIPAEFDDYELEFTEPNITRSQINDDTHLLEHEDMQGNRLDDDDDWDGIRDSHILQDLQKLHNENFLNTPNMGYNEFINLRKNYKQNIEAEKIDVVDIPVPVTKAKIRHGIDPANILPENSKRRVIIDESRNTVRKLKINT